MKRAIFAFPLALIMVGGAAEARTNSLALSCSAARDLVQRRGRVLFNTGPHTFEKIVSSRRYCDYDQILQDRWIPTADRRQCAAGYKCIPRNSVDDY